MAIEIDGTTVETTETGFLVNTEDWNENVAHKLAEVEGITLGEKHWDLIKYLRDEYINNNSNQPNNRSILKAMSEAWATKADSKSLYELFPGNPSKQAGQIAGLPESRRKGGY